MSELDPTEAEMLPDEFAEIGSTEDRWEKAVAAILHGVSLLDADGCDREKQTAVTRSDLRKSITTVSELLTPAVYQKGKFYRFPRRIQRLLYHIGETGDFTKSCVLAHVEQASAARFFRSEKFLQYVDERLKESAIRRGWTVDHWFAELNGVWEGSTVKTREQMQAIVEIGNRIAPKIERIQHEFDSSEFEFATRET